MIPHSILSALEMFYRQPQTRAWKHTRPAQRIYMGLSLCILLAVLAGCASSGTTSTSHPLDTSPKALPTNVAGSATVPTVKSTDWITYHRDNTRTGYVANTPNPQQLARAWDAQLDASVYGEPLVVNGNVIVATEADSLYSLSASTGKVLWHTQVGNPQDQTKLPCGDINPLGITSTPAYDSKTGLIFTVAEIAGPAHLLIGLDAQTGQVKVRRSADPNGIDPTPYQQRSALLVANGYVYWALGGLAGDCGNYKGTVIASRTNGQGPLLSYTVPTQREAGIWSTPGPVADAQGKIFVSVGNGAATQGTWDKSDSILRLSPTLQLEDSFAPAQWQTDNSRDFDLGSLGPVQLSNGIIFAAGKSSQGYTMHANALGGIGGQLHKAAVCQGLAMGGAATMATTVIVPCTGGLQQIQVGNDGSMKLGWHAQQAVHMSPIIGGQTVYSLDDQGTLYALDLATGKVRTQLALNITAIPHFETPTLSGNHIFVGTDTGIIAVKLS
ncbi:MAG TPA: PQQ-binding-like beta-propeller repeat protein [Ktedonobacteraceae bacterium]|nr:PQQ-binding-like beta-propeller repeat protein [Ktedonobacteraceae bacterium]